MMNDNISYRMLRHLLENAWEEDDRERLVSLSRVIDELALEHLCRQAEGRQAM